jgi:hypothetical protein
MYYFKVGVTIVFIIEFFASLAYTLYLSIKVATRNIERKEAMRRSFSISFLTVMFMFVIYLMWQDMSNLNFRGWVAVVVLITGFSFFVASVFALALWNWKK